MGPPPGDCPIDIYKDLAHSGKMILPAECKLWQAVTDSGSCAAGKLAFWDVTLLILSGLIYSKATGWTTISR